MIKYSCSERNFLFPLWLLFNVFPAVRESFKTGKSFGARFDLCQHGSGVRQRIGKSKVGMRLAPAPAPALAGDARITPSMDGVGGVLYSPRSLQ